MNLPAFFNGCPIFLRGFALVPDASGWGSGPADPRRTWRSAFVGCANVDTKMRAKKMTGMRILVAACIAEGFGWICGCDLNPMVSLWASNAESYFSVRDRGKGQLFLGRYQALVALFMT